MKTELEVSPPSSPLSLLSHLGDWRLLGHSPLRLAPRPLMGWRVVEGQQLQTQKNESFPRDPRLLQPRKWGGGKEERVTVPWNCSAAMSHTCGPLPPGALACHMPPAAAPDWPSMTSPSSKARLPGEGGQGQGNGLEGAGEGGESPVRVSCVICNHSLR